MGRVERIDFEREFSSTKVYTDLGEKIDLLCSKIDNLNRGLRHDDDVLLLTMFKCLNEWHEEQQAFHSDLKLLKARIEEVNAEIRRLQR